jgi:hypothetical protein
MMNAGKYRFFAAAAYLAVALALALAAPAHAADAVFPTASRVGLVPPPGMTLSKSFLGFEDVAKDSAVLLATQPAAAYPELEKSLATDALKKQGITVEKRETMKFDFGNGALVTGKQPADKTTYRKWLLVAQGKDFTVLLNAQTPEQETAYPDAVMRAALASLAARATVPDAEKLSLLPFAIGDLAGFHIQRVLPGRALLLLDTPDGEPTDNFDARMFIVIFPGGPAESDERANFARLAFGQIAGIKDVRITMSEPLRIGGQPGFQTTAQAKDAQSNTDIMVAQWLRFGGGAVMQMIGMAKADGWTTALSRMRAIRDSIEPK